MGWLTATMTDRSNAADTPRPTEVRPVDAERRERFLDAARPGLDRAYRLAGLLLGNATEAEDAVQDALVVAWQRFDDLRDAHDRESRNDREAAR
jgi:DNA-directed RNA polymerase specialized sigma24 family protein